MAFNDPKAITDVATEKGIEKAHLPWDKQLVAGFLAGAYIAFGGLLAITVSAGLDPETWGGLITLATGGVFTLGLILVVVAGSELLTGNMAVLPLAAYRDRLGGKLLARNLALVTIGNLLGSLFVAYFLAFLGNLGGAAIFVAGFYWYLYGRQMPAEPQAGDEPDRGRLATVGAAFTDGDRADVASRAVR